MIMPTPFVSGTFKRHFAGQAHEYRSFVPTPINRPYQWADARIPVLLEEATQLVGELNAYSTLVPDVDFFIQMHVRNEAVKSSRIEGTRTNMEEAVLPESEVDPEKRDDWSEVQNYIRALNHSIAQLETLPVSMRLLYGAHAILLDGVRGESKQPGEVRSSQNWIGGSSINSATFVPPHPDDVRPALGDLELFWHNRELQIPHLLRIAISHYQFETIHPFNDGNGRIGRMLMTLQLMDYGMLKKPTLYLSDFFERNKGAYYDALTLVREQHNLDQWLLFFLAAVIETARKSQKTFERIIELRSDYERRVLDLGRRAKPAHKLIVSLFSEPAVTVSGAGALLGTTFASANLLVGSLVDLGILREVTGFSRNRVFVLHEYVDIFKD